MNNHKNIGYLIRVILDQIEKNKVELANYHRINLRNKFRFKFIKKTRFYIGSGDDIGMFTTSEGEISPHNIGRFLGFGPKAVKRWLSKLDGKDFSLGKRHLLNFRKIRHMILRTFNGSGKGIAEGRLIIETALNNFMKEYYAEMDYITKILFLLDDYAIWETKKGVQTHSESYIEKKLSGQNYLQGLREASIENLEFEERSKYFKLAVNILLLKYSDFKFKSLEKYEQFKENSLDIIYQEMVRVGLFDEEIEGMRIQYDTLVHTLYTLTCARFNKYFGEDLNQFKDKHKNPKGLYTLSFLSEKVSNGRRQTIGEYLHFRKFITPEKVARIKLTLKTNEKYALSESWRAKELLDELPKQRYKNRQSYVGQSAHPILENILRKALLRKLIKSRHEYTFNRPNSLHRIDSSIEITSESDLIKLIESSQKMNLDNFQFIFIDYTIPSLKKLYKNVLGKLRKNYQAEDRMLIVMFYGKTDYGDIFNSLQGSLASYKAQYKEKVRFMDIMEFASTIKLDPDFIKELNALNKLVIEALKGNDDALDTLDKKSDGAVYELEKDNGKK